MPSSRSRRSKSKQQKPGLSLDYNGPVRLNTYGGQDSRPVRANLSYTFTMGADSTGVLSNIIRSPGLTSTSDWTNYFDLYQEFRVLAIELQYMPYFNGTFDSTVVQGAGAVNTVHVPLGALPLNLDEVVQHNTWSPFRTSTPFKKAWKMFGVEEAVYSTVTTVGLTNHGGISFYCDALTPNTDYGRGVVTYLVEFRGRK